MPRKKQRQGKTPGHAYYPFQIAGWDWSYSFIANVVKWEEKRFSDCRHLIVSGTALRPRRINVETAELAFLPNVTPEEFELKHDRPPPGGRSRGTFMVMKSLVTSPLRKVREIQTRFGTSTNSRLPSRAIFSRAR